MAVWWVADTLFAGYKVSARVRAVDARLSPARLSVPGDLLVELTTVLFRPEFEEIPGGREMMTGELDKLGPTSWGEWRVLEVFVFAAARWVTVPLVFDDPPNSDVAIAFAVPFHASGGRKERHRLRLRVPHDRPDDSRRVLAQSHRLAVEVSSITYERR
ncbi:anion permease [uncultured Aeromicrobium sp.]|uniref:anion permease n=1 Tax=uncultured Aeromicrobium sp. TaxID=337820 RepID=UPI0025E14E86|nr:anion permease [uncultured Aeromicrobium sp.]